MAKKEEIKDANPLDRNLYIVYEKNGDGEVTGSTIELRGAINRRAYRNLGIFLKTHDMDMSKKDEDGLPLITRRKSGEAGWVSSIGGFRKKKGGSTMFPFFKVPPEVPFDDEKAIRAWANTNVRPKLSQLEKSRKIAFKLHGNAKLEAAKQSYRDAERLADEMERDYTKNTDANRDAVAKSREDGDIKTGESEELMVQYNEWTLEIDELIKNLRFDNNITDEYRKALNGKLEQLKEEIVNFADGEEIKKFMEEIINTVDVQGFPYSFKNRILIKTQQELQGKNGIVNSPSRWRDNYERSIVPGAKPFYVIRPDVESAANIIRKSKEEKKEIINTTLRDENVNDREGLSPGAKGRLEKDLFDDVSGVRQWDFTPVYDESDTKPLEGSEDILAKSKEANVGVDTVTQFEETQLSDKIRPMYNAILDFIEKEPNMSFQYVDILADKAATVDDKIRILKNAGNDVGLTVKLLREVLILHLTNEYKKPAKKGFNISPKTIRNQAVLGGWVIMRMLKFDVTNASVDHALLFGGNKENALAVLDTVTSSSNAVAEFLLKKVGAKPKNSLHEDGGYQMSMITPEMIIDFLGVEEEFAELKRQEEIKESLRKGITSK